MKLCSSKLVGATLPAPERLRDEVYNHDFSGCDFSGTNWAKIDFSGVNLSGVDFYGSDLTGLS